MSPPATRPPRLLGVEKRKGYLRVEWVPWVPGARWILMGGAAAMAGVIGFQGWVLAQSSPGAAWWILPFAVFAAGWIPVLWDGKMVLEVDRGRLKAGFTTLPFGKVDLPTEGIEEVETEEHTSYRNGRAYKSSRVYLRYRDGRREWILGTGTTAELAALVDGELRAVLGLEPASAG